MPKLTPDQFATGGNLTYDKVEEKASTDLSMEYPEYSSAQILTDENITYDGGTSLKFKLQTKNTGNARVTGLFGQNAPSTDNLTIEGDIPWSKIQTSYTYDIDEDIFQRGGREIVSELTVRQHAAQNDKVELNEQLMWNNPTSDSKSPRGIPHYLVTNSGTAGLGGWGGGNPTGWTGGAAGINSDTYARWKNWTFGWTSIGPDDLIAKIKKALVFTNFHAPNPHNEIKKGPMKRIIYSTYRVTEPLERYSEGRNENMRADIAMYVGQTVASGVPIRFVHELEANYTKSPLFGVDWSVIRPFCQRGMKNRKLGPLQAPHQSSVREVYFDTWMNYVCFNRRKCWAGLEI